MSAAPACAPPPLLVAQDVSPAVFEALDAAECALAIWRRPLPAALAPLAAVDPETVDDVEAELAVADAVPDLAFLLGAAGYPRDIALALARDAGGLAARHAAARGDARARVRLEWIETDACRRFHMDVVTTRLLSTYRGRGTQWRAADAPETAAREAAAGDVLILKGRRLLPQAPLLHRSPPIAGTGEHRLLLVVDAADFGDPA